MGCSIIPAGTENHPSPDQKQIGFDASFGCRVSSMVLGR